MNCQSDYLTTILVPKALNKVINTLKRLIVERVGLDNFDAIAYRGMSGAGVATALGFLLNKPLIMVRKPNQESAHTTAKAEGVLSAERIIIVDDLIATGNTILKMVKTIGEEGVRDRLKVVAIFLYNDSDKYYEIDFQAITNRQKFANIFAYNIVDDPQYKEALVAVESAKVYGFKVNYDHETGKVSVISGNRFLSENQISS